MSAKGFRTGFKIIFLLHQTINQLLFSSSSITDELFVHLGMRSTLGLIFTKKKENHITYFPVIQYTQTSHMSPSQKLEAAKLERSREPHLFSVSNYNVAL